MMKTIKAYWDTLFGISKDKAVVDNGDGTTSEVNGTYMLLGLVAIVIALLSVFKVKLWKPKRRFRRPRFTRMRRTFSRARTRYRSRRRRR